MLSRYYAALGPKEIGELSLYQFYSYLYEIPNIEKIFTGKTEENNKPVQKMTNKIDDNCELVKQAKKLGLKVPRYY